MIHDVMTNASSEDGGGGPVFMAVLCFFLLMGLVQVVRPQLLWQLNSRLQRGWVGDPEATEPTRKGYMMYRVTGVLFLAFAAWMLFQQF